MKLIATVAALVMAVSAFAAQDDTVVAAGDPPLTRKMVDKARDFLEWVFEVPLTGQQRKTIEDAIVASWTENKSDEIAGTLQILEAADQIAALPPEARPSVRAMLQPELVKELRAVDDPASKWMIDIYDNAHRQIAAGPPALTRQMSDAQAEMFAFVISEAGGEKFEADKAYLDAWAQTLVKNYPSMDAAQRKEVIQAPIEWANLRYTWTRMNEEQRAEAQKGWSTQLQSVMPQNAIEQKVAKAIQQVEKLFGDKTLEQVSAKELEQAARALEEAASALAQEPGAEAKQTAAQLKQTAVALKKAGAEKAAGKAAAGSSTSVQSAMQALQSQQDSFRNAMNMSMQMHYSRVNSINILGGNPMRYTNQFGAPY